MDSREYDEVEVRGRGWGQVLIDDGELPHTIAWQEMVSLGQPIVITVAMPRLPGQSSRVSASGTNAICSFSHRQPALTHVFGLMA